jgi:amino acid transporter
VASGVRRLLLGSPIPTAHEMHHRLSKVQALAVFSSDALSSVAYATEEILLVLVLAGTAALGLSVPIALAIAGLLAVVGSSYYQTIHGYPSGGGAYIVANDNLGVWPGLVAAAALLIDYVLTVAVSTTAGVAAVTSAFPSLYSLRIPLCLGSILFIAWANLRGVRESGTLFAIPTYGFLLVILGMVVLGLFRLATGTLGPPPTAPAAQVTAGAHALTLFLILRAFASGCTALTGIEAISNGIRAFRKPEADNAGKTLIAMVILLATMFVGITFLAWHLGVVPVEQDTVVSQIGRQIFGAGPLYLSLQAGTALILILAANTSFADFPRLASIMARDRNLPRQLANLGDRLVFSNGIMVLALFSAALIVVFGGETHRLIPLYAIGVFLAFTLSQSGMVVHWFREQGETWRIKAGINGLGACATAVVLVVIVASKFVYGAWIVILLLPLCVWMFRTINDHYARVAEQLSLEGLKPEGWVGLASRRRHKVIVPISGIHRGSLPALRFSRSLSKDVTAVVVDVEPEVTARIRDKWPRWGHDIPLVVLESPYRSTIGPLLAYLDEVDAREPDRGLAVVVLPEFVTATWWQNLLHNQTVQLVKRALVYRRGQAAKDRVIIDVPYHLTR